MICSLLKTIERLSEVSDFLSLFPHNKQTLLSSLNALTMAVSFLFEVLLVEVGAFAASTSVSSTTAADSLASLAEEEDGAPTFGRSGSIFSVDDSEVKLIFLDGDADIFEVDGAISITGDMAVAPA